jgi:hypothetical protein
VTRHLARFRPSDVAAWNEWGRAGEALTLAPRGRVRPTDRGLFLAQDLAAELFARADSAGREARRAGSGSIP